MLLAKALVKGKSFAVAGIGMSYESLWYRQNSEDLFTMVLQRLSPCRLVVAEISGYLHH